MLRRIITSIFLITALACTGDVGPTGPTGVPGIQGVQGEIGQTGPGANFWFVQGFADQVGIYQVLFSDTKPEEIVVQCWSRAEVSLPWVQLAVALDDNGLLRCAKYPDGFSTDLLVEARTHPFFEVLIVAITVQ